ncbi:MAG TPA: hypothetical protein VM283_07140 [Armatimonadota bacterium]|nr:hypothetical protein [Armatimonadota bacterium]
MEWRAQEELGHLTGVVVPAFFSAKPSDELVQRLLRMTLIDSHHYLPPEQVWVVVDGDERTARIASEVQQELRARAGVTFHLHTLEHNRGKFLAVREGMRALLRAHPDVQYLAVRDGDGDHAVTDLPTLVRAAAELAVVHGDTSVLIAGARSSRHHPMGWLRGELESLLDGVTLDALAYRLAREGCVLDLTRAAAPGNLPDISSGYKVYGRQAAERIFGDHPPHLASLSERDYWRYGPETVPFVEAILGGTAFGQTSRVTSDGQPTSSFSDFSMVHLYGELLAWVFTRLEIPLAAAALLFDNRACRVLLRTAAEGAETLEAVRRRALERTAAYLGTCAPIPDARPLPTSM